MFTLDVYNEIANSINAMNAGVGDWIFRQAAFPELVDNLQAYFRRYFPRNDAQTQRTRQLIANARTGLDSHIEQVIDTYRLDEYDVVGFTSMFSQNVPALAVARHLKERNPDIITVIGGANCEAPMGQELVINSPHLDYVFSGPALISMRQFVERLLHGERSRVCEIMGVFDRESALANRGKTIIGEELDIDEIIELDYAPFIDMVQSRYPGGQMPVVLPFETSRGCWWGERAHCTFCGLNGMSMAYRSMDPDKAYDLINSLFRFAPHATRLECVDNIMPKSYVAGVFSRLQTPPSMEIFYEVKADLTEAELRTLAGARVRVLQPGIEAFSTATLKLMRKGTTSFNNITFLMHCARYDIFPVWNLLIGFPGEPTSVFDKYLRDLPKMVHLPPPHGVYPLRFDRFSPYFKDAARYGLQLQPLPFYEMSYPFDREALANMAYYFGDVNFKADYLKGVVQYVGRLQQIIDRWSAQWQSGARPALTMSLADGRARVHDSRSGVPRIHDLSDAAADVLGVIGRRRTRGEIANALSHRAEGDVLEGLRELEQRDLVFEESGMFMNLVMPGSSVAAALEIEAVLD
jgi:magnesium-protoporphyrin IX monomethyl ester (oxidative) cyclase